MNLLEVNREYVERELFSERSLQGLLKYFPDYKSVLIYHAKRMQEIFPHKPTLGICDFCKQSPAFCDAKFNWRGNYYNVGKNALLAFLMVMTHHGHSSVPDSVIDFTTHHGLCSSCLKATKWRRTFTEIGESLFFTFLLITVLLFFSGLILFGITIGWKLERFYLLWSLTGMLVGFAGIVASICCQNRIYGWIVPRKFRMIAKQPFKLIGVNSFES